VLVILSLLAFFAIALPDAMLGVAWPFMRITFDQPLAAMTLILPFGVAATVISASFWTYAATRIGLGRLLAWSVAASAAALLCCALAPGYWLIVASAVVFGLSAGAIDSALNAYAARHFGPRRINQMHAAFGLGAATSPMIVTTVVGTGASWRWAYAVVMVMQAILAVSFAATTRHWDAAAYQPEPSAPTATRSGVASTRRWWHQRKAMGGLLVVVVESGLEAVVGLWAFVFLLEALSLPPSIAGPTVSGYWVGIVVGRVLLGPLAERLGPWPVLAGATTLAAAAAILLVLGHPALAVLGVVVLGLSLAPVYPLLVLTTAERTTPPVVDRLVGLQAAASTVGSVLCPGLVGLLMDVSANAFAVGVLVLTLAAGGGIWLLAPGRRRPT
jgi:MFS family permease